MEALVKKNLEKQGYRIVGRHSAIKVCLWCKRAIKNEDVCYKNTFYGIQSWRCIQASVSVLNCYNSCQFCWRSLEHTIPKEVDAPDSPKMILEGFIEEQKEYLQGFGGNIKSNEKRFKEALNPRHVALSLSGDATLYPNLPNLIKEIHNREMTSFLVTNGLNPGMLKKLQKEQPTQTYVTLAAPNEEIYKKVCKPLISSPWEKLQESLSTLQNFDRGTIRLTLAKGLNMLNPEEYAATLKNLDVGFIEIKAAMPVGYAQYRLTQDSMPLHTEIRLFAKKICQKTNLKMVDEKQNSRVVLLMKKDSPQRKLKF